MCRNVSHTAAYDAFSSKNFDFKSVIVIIILLAHSNEKKNKFENNACNRDFQKAAGIPTDSKLLVWADMFLPESRERRIQVKGNDVLQVCEAYWEDW